MATEPRLDDSAAAWLERIRTAGGSPVPESAAQARAAHDAAAALLAGPGEAVQDVVDSDVDRVPVRTYRPAGGSSATVVYLHGGGWVAGTLDSYDTLCRSLANRTGVTVASVGYSLAPEKRHPAQVEQVLAVLRWFGRGGLPLAVAGDSAGGYVAVHAAARARDVGIRLAALGLIYPAVDPAAETPSSVEVGTGYALTTEAMRWYWAQFLPEDRSAWLLDAAALNLAGLPPTMVLTAGFDPLRDEGIALVGALAAAGVPVEHVSFPGQMHGFVRAAALIPEATDALAQVGAFLADRMSPSARGH